LSVDAESVTDRRRRRRDGAGNRTVQLVPIGMMTGRMQLTWS
jgi:hypothetical protein